MTTQALIAAGGLGTRMSSRVNPANDKTLIECADQSMIGHLIDGLKKGGIKTFIFSSGYHNFEKIKKIVKSKKISAVVVPYFEEDRLGYRKIPYILQDLLEDQFMFVCGHHPLPPEFVSKMLQVSKKCDCVITAYDNSLYPTNRENKILYEGSIFHPVLKVVNTKTHRINPNHKYVRNPYIVKKELIKLAVQENFQYAFSYYLYLYWQKGGKLAVIKTSIPPEFDYDHEFEKTKLFLGKINR